MRMNKPTTTAYESALQIVGGVSAMAKAFEITPWAASKWRKKVPAERCPTIEKLTGGVVLCEQLRPDVDWSYLRGTQKLKAVN